MANFDVDIVDFVESCSKHEIDELIDYLKEHDYLEEESVVDILEYTDDDDVDKVISYLQSHNYIPTSIESPNVLDKLWLDTCNKLTNIRLQLSTEDEEIINSIVKKY